MDEPEQFATVLKEYMQTHQYTPRRLADLTHIPEDTIKGWQSSRVSSVREWQRVLILSAAFDLDECATRRLLRASRAPVTGLSRPVVQRWLATLKDAEVCSMVEHWFQKLDQPDLDQLSSRQPSQEQRAARAGAIATQQPADAQAPLPALDRQQPNKHVRTPHMLQRLGLLLGIFFLGAVYVSLWLRPAFLWDIFRGAPQAQPRDERALALITPAVSQELATQQKLEPAHCSGESCTGKDPTDTLCSLDAITVARTVVDSVGDLELRWSERCKVNWGKLVSTNKNIQQVKLYLQIKAKDGSMIDAAANVIDVEVRPEQPVFTNQWFAPTGQIYVSACAVVEASKPRCTAFK